MCFWTLRGDAAKLLENRINQSAIPSSIIRAGPAQTYAQHGRPAHGRLVDGKLSRGSAGGKAVRADRV